MDPSDITLFDYWRIIRKRKGIIFYVTAVVFLSTIGFTRLQTPIYETMTEVKIDRKEAAPVPAYMADYGPNLATEIQIFKSLAILGKAVERTDVLPDDPDLRLTARYALARKYRGHISVSQVPDSNILSIRVRAQDPDRAVLLANAVVDAYIEERVNGGTQEARAVLAYTKRELAGLEQKISDGERELQKTKYNEKVFAATPEVKAALERLSVEETFAFESDLLRTANELEGLGREIDRRRKSGLMAFLSDNTIPGDYIFSGLKRKLLELEFERALLLIDYTGEHPQVIRQDQLIAETRDRMARLVRRVSRTPLTADMEKSLSLVIEQLYLRSRQEVLNRIVNKTYADSGSLSADDLRYRQLQRNVDRALERYNRTVEKSEQAELAIVSGTVDVVIVSPAVPVRTPVKPDKNVNYLVGLLMGFLLGLLLAFVVETLDTTIGTLEGVEQLLQLPVLGIIPVIHVKRGRLKAFWEGETPADRELRSIREKLVAVFRPETYECDSFKTLRINVLEKVKGGGHKLVLVTSAGEGEGKSTVAANLAVSLAQMGKKTLLIDANVRHPAICRLFGVPRGPGLTEALIGQTPWKETLKTVTDILVGQLNVDDLLRAPGLDNLKIMTSGEPVLHPGEIFNSERLGELLDGVKEGFDIVIVDSAAVLSAPDSSLLAARLDGTVMVYRAGATKREALKRACQQVRAANPNMDGVVLNQLDMDNHLATSFYYRRHHEGPSAGWRRVLQAIFQRACGRQV
jgi:uncharacterized protein involved in exopolysaccharide biosynthesis/Mrp family chromosome partitioning ATPase